MNIVFISPEVVPFAKTGGLADVSGVLPVTLSELGHKCSVIIPLYSHVRKNGFNPKLIKSNIKVPLGPHEYYFNLGFISHKNTDIYFVDNKAFYDRVELYGTPQGDYPDNALRFAFFAKAALLIINALGKVDIVHCNDWQSALVPFYLKFLFKKDSSIGTLFTIHNLAYQGLFDMAVMPMIDIPDEFFAFDKLEFYGKLNFMKAGILYSDAISTVSKGYAKEILTEEFGCGLDGLLRTRRDSLFGIINGADYNEWNPKIDKYIIKNYDENALEHKEECKKDLLKYFKLPLEKRKPVIGMITRLAEQKGIDLVAEGIKQILSLGVYFVLLGTGNEKYNNLFKKIANKHKKSVGVEISFNNTLAHKIEAGSDIFLMPSRYEPCGLGQMYSLKYGAIPVVRATGGLDDTIIDYNSATGKGNGFKFSDASPQALFITIKRAVNLYNKDERTWAALQKSSMKYDFSWKRSAQEYIKLYTDIIHRKPLIEH